MSPSLSFVVPALNEEPHLADTIREAVDALRGLIDDYEILIVDDGSTDRTGEIADALARANPRIQVVHHPSPRGLGYAYKLGVRAATREHVLLVPGDNELRQDSLREICVRIGRADIVLTYALNPEIRPLPRRIVSRLFAWIVRNGAGIPVRYFNGPVVHRTRLVQRALDHASDGFTYQAEILVRMIQAGATYVEVGMYLNPRPKTSAFRLANVLDVFKGTLKLIYRVRREENPFTLAEPVPDF